MNKKNSNLKPFGKVESKTILQELTSQGENSQDRALNNKMVDKMLGIQKKNNIGIDKANRIYERFMDYDKKKKRNTLNRKIECFDKENHQTQKQSLGRGTHHKEKFLERVGHMIEARQKKIAKQQFEKVITEQKKLLEECTFKPAISRDEIYQ